MRRALLSAGLAGALALSAVADDRVKADRPVEMTAKGGLSVNLKAQTGHAKGDVVIRRDDVTVCCDEADATFADNKIQRVECRGRVVIVRPDGTWARADLAVFEAKSDQVTLTGGARVKSPEGTLEGEKIIYQISTDQLEVAGKQSRFHFVPKSSPGEPERRCPPP
ncbi:MAG: LptA/OstA family protein [Myxococcota bacterium]